MKKVALSIVTMVVMSSSGFAGGDIEPVEAAAVIEDDVSPFYVGLGLSNTSTRISRVSLGFFKDKTGQEETGDILLMTGYDFNQYLAVEGRYMNSVFGEDSLSRESWGVYVKPKYPATEAFTLYALLGYGGLNTDGKDIVLANVNDTSFQWGVGASYGMDEHFAIFIDYVNIAKNMDADILLRSGLASSDVDSDALAVGVTYNF